MKNTKQQRNQKGFTMIELMIVIVIMGIIGAAIVPTFGSMSKKARIASDVSNIKILQRQADIYEAEKGEKAGDTAEAITTKLIEEEYLEDKYMKETSNGTSTTYNLDLQTPNATLNYADGKFNLQLPTGYEVKDDDPNKEWVTNPSSSGSEE